MKPIISHPLPDHGPLKPYGILLHTTGSGIIDAAQKKNKKPIDVAVDTYQQMAKDAGVGPHYCIDPEGQIVQFRNDDEVAWHAGVSAVERRSFLDGSWETDNNRIDKLVVSAWKTRWGAAHKSPQHLYPTESPNHAYVGIELIPCREGSTWLYGSKPGFDNQKHSVEQYLAVAELCNDIAKHYGLDLSNPLSGTLVEHSSVNPYTRPGWDLGWTMGFFSENLLRGLLKAL